MAKSFREIVGIPPSTASTADSVLIIIDAQNEYAVGQLKTENIDQTRKIISSLLEKYRAGQAPIVHVVHLTPDGAPVFTPNSHLAEELSELEPKAGEKLVGKRRISAFEGTDLDEYLRGTGRNKLVLTGYMSHVCVSSTARTASDRGYEVIVVEDGVGDRDIPGATAAQVVSTVLAEIGDSFGTILKSTDVN